MITIIFVVFIILYAAFSYSLQRLCRELDVKPAWLAWTPFCPVLMYKAGDQAWWWFVLLFIPFIQLIALVILVIAWIKIFRKTNWKLAIIPVILFFLLLSSWVFAIQSVFSSSEPYKMAVNQIRQNPIVIESLGEPISIKWVTQGRIETSKKWVTQGRIETSNDSGLACLIMSITGSKTKGLVYVDAEQQRGKWKFRQLAVAIDGRNEPIVLTTPPLNYSRCIEWFQSDFFE